MKDLYYKIKRCLRIYWHGVTELKLKVGNEWLNITNENISWFDMVMVTIVTDQMLSSLMY